jgi:hypothetical protein
MLNKNKIVRSILIIIILILLAIPVILVLSTSQPVLISNSQSQFFTAKSVVIIGNKIICLKGSSIYPSRDIASKIEEKKFSPAILSLNDYVLIEILHKTETVETEKKGEIEGIYTGVYQVVVTGHTGFLYLTSKDGYLYGSIQFPKWANGVYEPLKNVYFSKGKINFTRSVTDAMELKRIGANSYFVQQYSGEFSADGSIIKGYYVKDGTNHIWQANKIK